MLYPVGSHLGYSAATAPVATTARCSDTVSIINDWDPESFQVSRQTVTYAAGDGMPSQSWSVVETFEGDWQPVSGTVMRQEEGRKIKSTSFIITPCDVDVSEGDRVYRADNSYEYVNYVKRYSGHITIFLTDTVGSD